MSMSSAAQKRHDDYQALLLVMQDVLGVVVDDENHAQIRQKLKPIMAEYGFGSFSVLAKAMREEASKNLLSSVLQSIIAHDSVWFGYPDINKLVTEYVLPGIADKNKADFRVWIVGCGQGQTVYSTAMIIEEFKQQYDMVCDVEILATDLSESIVSWAEKGRYDSSMLAGLPLAYKQKYMDARDDQWEVDKTLRSMVQFETCDLLESFTDRGHFDVIICPDVLIYFSNDVKSKILHEFAELLSPSGVLLVSANEPVALFCNKFDLVNHDSGVFYRQIPG
jgi:chemotaxis protein methyltransferase CheR